MGQHLFIALKVGPDQTQKQEAQGNQTDDEIEGDPCGEKKTVVSVKFFKDGPEELELPSGSFYSSHGGFSFLSIYSLPSSTFYGGPPKGVPEGCFPFWKEVRTTLGIHKRRDRSIPERIEPRMV